MKKFLLFVAAFFVVCVDYVSGMDAIGTAELDVREVEGNWVISLKVAADSRPVVHKIPKELIVKPYGIDLGGFEKASIELCKGRVEFILGKIYYWESISANIDILNKPSLLFSRISCEGCDLEATMSEAERKVMEDLKKAGKIVVNGGTSRLIGSSHYVTKPI